ncbi:MFS transporter [Nocardia vaccinii]|uniref:MFS transporter n=1 Tax=Nocardia vaccinii TaxID=1822 RepID=UPI0008306DCF|nr:MFS transporter [Nocardia vaccinii]
MSTISTTPTPDSVDDDASTGRLVNASRLRIFTVLAVIVLYTEVAPLQFVMVGAALQKMTKTFPTVGANLSWTIIIMTIVGASATPLLGKMGDVWGKKRIFLTCGLFFVAGCLIDALTTNWTLFLVGRGLQAFAIATQMISYGLIRDLLPRKYIPVAVGLTATGLGFSGVLGPIIGGLLVDHFEWHAMFWFLGIYTLVMTPLIMLIVPESKLRVKERIDPLGAVLLAAGAALTLLYLDKGQDWGWSRPSAFGWLIGGLALLALFFIVETRVSRPIIDMRLLLHPAVGLTLIMAFFGTFIQAMQTYAMGYMTQTPNAAQLSTTVAQGVAAEAHKAAGVTMPVSLIRVVLDPRYTYGSGFTLLQYAVHISIIAGGVAMVFGPLGGLLARRIGARIPAIISLIVMVGAGIGYATVPYSWQAYAVLAAIFGIGAGFFYASAPILMVDAVPQEQQGISLGMFGVLTSIGAGTGIAITSALLNNNPINAHISVMGHSITQPIPQVFGDRGWSDSFWAMSACAAVALVVAVVMRHGRTPSTGGAVRLEVTAVGASSATGVIETVDTEPN